LRIQGLRAPRGRQKRPVRRGCSRMARSFSGRATTSRAPRSSMTSGGVIPLSSGSKRIAASSRRRCRRIARRASRTRSRRRSTSPGSIAP